MNKVVQYIIINREIILLGAGVLATQAAHASMAGYLIAAESEAARAWASGTFTKIVLVAETELALRELDAALNEAGVPHKMLLETRLDQKATAIGVAPLPKQELGKLLGHFALLK